MRSHFSKFCVHKLVLPEGHWQVFLPLWLKTDRFSIPTPVSAIESLHLCRQIWALKARCDAAPLSWLAGSMVCGCWLDVGMAVPYRVW